jgi:hypothetical protein
MEENHKQYHQAIPEKRLTNTGFNMLVVTGPATTTKNTGGYALYSNGQTPHVTI